MDLLINGVSRFQGEVFPGKSERFRDLAQNGQAPKTLMISCADSRVVPELITQSEPGDLFVCRNAGNIVPPYSRHPGGVSSAIEYAVVALGVEDIVICGHSDCGAMKAFQTPEALETMPTVKEWLSHSHAAHEAVQACCADQDSAAQTAALIRENVVVQLTHLKSHPCVAAGLAAGKLRLHGWVFDIESGDVEALDGMTGEYHRATAEGLVVADRGRAAAPAGQRKEAAA